MNAGRSLSARGRFVRIVAVVAGLGGIAFASTLIGVRCTEGSCVQTKTSTAPNASSTPSPTQPSTVPATRSGAKLASLGTTGGGATTGAHAVVTSFRSITTGSRRTQRPEHDGTGGTPSSPSTTPQDAHSAIRYIADGVTSAVSSVKALGYNVIDTSSTSRSTIDGFGAKVIIYTGYDKDTCQWKVPDATWQSQVLNLEGDQNVVGWFLADEPHPYIAGRCTSSAAQIRARADFLHANAPGQKAMIVVLDGSNACVGLSEGCEYKFFNEAATHADLIGVDPYVCSTAHPACDYAKIGQRVQSAVANGIPLTKIMPVYQAFGGDGYYLMPTAAQQSKLLQTWDSLAPPGGWAGEYTYEWFQGSEPDGLSNHPEVQSVFATHNGV